VEWSQQFEKPCIVFEDLKEMRDSIDYGTRMNRRLHHLPFRALQYYTSYKTVFKSVPTAWIPPNTRASGVRCVDTRSERTATKNGSSVGRASIKITPTEV